MAEDVQDVRWKEFNGLGEEEVRKRITAHIWGEYDGDVRATGSPCGGGATAWAGNVEA